MITCPEWEWAEVDGERLVWVVGGKLFGGLPGREIELKDFNGMEFERIEAPSEFGDFGSNHPIIEKGRRPSHEGQPAALLFS